MKVLVDVGAHKGETVDMGMELFDRVYGFEPSLRMFQILQRNMNGYPDVFLFPFGWWKKDVVATLRNGGNAGASIFMDKPHYDAFNTIEPKDETAFFIQAAYWTKVHLSEQDDNYLKINCEGAECEILTNLINSGEISKFTKIAVDFDALKVPSQEKFVDTCMSLMDKLGINYFDSSGLADRREVIQILSGDIKEEEATSWKQNIQQ